MYHQLITVYELRIILPCGVQNCMFYSVFTWRQTAHMSHVLVSPSPLHYVNTAVSIVNLLTNSIIGEGE